MERATRESVAERIEQLDILDSVLKPLQQAAGRAVPQGSGLKDLLSGTWLGHPLHPPLTDVVIGAWTSALFLDLLGGEGAEQAADRLVSAGILAAVPTAAAGLSDWADLSGGNRRVGGVHAIGNTSALALHAFSLAARRRGDRRRGIFLSAAGYAVASFSAWLGGHLSFARGVGVNQAAFDDAPTEWTPVLDADKLLDQRLTRVQADGLGVLLVLQDGHVHALSDRCTHRGCLLHEGVLNGDATVTCPCHGSTFRLDGSIVKGPATSPQPSYSARVLHGKVEIRRRSAQG
jgi:nitrite reductase/ring-hydroxylating ferredoxin subunit/uncharacterized membrane protein